MRGPYLAGTCDPGRHEWVSGRHTWVKPAAGGRFQNMLFESRYFVLFSSDKGSLGLVVREQVAAPILVFAPLL